METDASAYLTSKGVAVFRANGAEVTAHCFVGCSDDSKGKGKLYLNTESWLWDCKKCGTSGNRRTLLRHFGDEDDSPAYLPGQDPTVRRRVLELATETAADMLLNNQRILDYLVGRGLTLQTILDYKLGYVPKNWSLCSSLGELAVADQIAAGVRTEAGRDFFHDKITIPYLQRGSVIQLRGKDPEGKYFTPSGDCVRLFNADTMAGASDVIITEGELDCLVLQQVLSLSKDPRVRATAVVGIPGANGLPSGFENMFTEAKRVYIGLDPDDVGKKAAIKIKGLLGSKARIVELPADLPKCDWTEYLTTRGKVLSDVMELLGTASGKRLWSMDEAGAKFRKRRTESTGIKTGFAELDSWFRPGLEPGDLMIPLAKTSVGKTNFLLNIAANTTTVPTLMVSLEMTTGQVYERLARMYRFQHPLAEDHEVDQAYSKLRIVDENRLHEGAVATLCDEYEDEMGFRPQLAMVDYLGYYAKGCKGSGAYEKTTNAVMALKAEAKDGEVALIAPHQVNRMAQDGKPIEADAARDSGAVEETADLLISLFRPDEAIVGNEQAPSGLVRCQVLKNRKGGKGMATNLMFSAASLVMVDAGTPAAKVVQDENRLIWRGDDYEAVRRYRQELAYKGAQTALRLA
jgi:hypothetical protein